MSKVLRPDEATQAETWSIPVVGDANSDARGDGGSPFVTAEKLESIQKQAYEEAWQQGLQQGVQAGQAAMQQKAAMLDNILRLLANPVEQVTGEVQQELVDLCIALMKQLVRRELKLDPGQVVAVVREALAALPVSARNIQVRLNPEDVRIIESALGSPDEQRNWHVVDDPVISRGGCKIVTETSRIDATIEARIAQLITQVFGGERESDRQGRRE